MRYRWIALIAVLLLAGSVAPAAAVTVFWTGANAFDDQTINFAPFLADQLTSISGSGYSDNGGSEVVFKLSIVLNGISTTLDMWSQGPGHHLLSERTAGGPLTFDAGLVSALRLQAIPPVNTAFNEFTQMYRHDDTTDMPTRFVFERVPEPATLLLLASALAVMAAVARRRLTRLRLIVLAAGECRASSSIAIGYRVSNKPR
jgi:hypothetical protein